MNDPRGKDDLEAQTNGGIRTPYAGQPDKLHNLIDVGARGDEEDPLAAMRDDPNYAALIRDLQTIAQAARELFKPTEEAPRDEVWEKIQSQLPTKHNA